MERKIIDRKLFTQPVLPPENRYSRMGVTIHPNGKFCMNGKLSQKLAGKHLSISFTADSKNFIIEETDDINAISFPKNGSKTLPSALDIIVSSKLTPPVKYDV